MNINKRGFTLIELLVVIAILSVLASVVLFSISVARDRAADTSIRANLANMRATASLAYNNDGNYGVETSVGGASTDGCTDELGGSVGTFLAGSLFGGSSDYHLSMQGMIDQSLTRSGASDIVCLSSGTSTGNAEDAQSWAVSVPKRTNDTESFCVDTQGAVVEGVAAVVSNVALCV